MSSLNGPAIPAIDAPAWWLAQIPDDRVDCGECARRSSPYCVVSNKTHVPVGILHRCNDFRQRRAR